MKKAYRPQMEARKHRLKRRAGEALREAGRAILLTGVIAVVTATLLAGYDWMIRSPHLRVRETVIRGCKELTEKDILTLAALRPASNILMLNLEAITRRIQANPWIKSVSVGREFPDRLVIVIRERRAVALLQKETGLYLLDSEGVPFKKLESGEENDLPVLTGCVLGDRIDEVLVKKSLAFLNELAGMKGIPSIGAAAEIHANENFGLTLFMDTGMCLKLGFDSYESKLKRLAPVMADLDHRNLKSGFLLIDLSDPAKVNVQKRNILGSPGPAGGGKNYRM